MIFNLKPLSKKVKCATKHWFLGYVLAIGFWAQLGHLINYYQSKHNSNNQYL